MATTASGARSRSRCASSRCWSERPATPQPPRAPASGGGGYRTGVPASRLVETRVPREPAAAVLVLHGGASRPGDPVVSPTQLSVLRMVPVAGRIARTGRDLAVFRVLNSVRGWGSTHTPVHDARWAMGQVREQYGDLPLGLVGHSLGGRAALLAGQEDGVRSVVALNPWVHPTDDADLSGREVLVVHGTEDRVALPQRAEQVVQRLRRRTSVEWLEVPGGGHAMLRHGSRFETAAADFVSRTLRPAQG